MQAAFSTDAATLMLQMVLPLCAFVAVALLTGVVRAYALGRSLLDIPNQRSSHQRPTPRGGGAALSLVFLVCVAGLGALGALRFDVVMAFLGGGAMVALIGWIDDHRDIAPALRALGQLLAAGWAVAWLGGVDSLQLGAVRVGLGWAGPVLAVLAIAWLTNLYNFMDGTDGLAATQGLCAAAMGALLLAGQGQAGMATVASCLAAFVQDFCYGIGRRHGYLWAMWGAI